MSARRQGGMDPVLLVIGSSLLLLGLIMVASASIVLADRDGGAALFFIQRQAVFALGGVACGLVATLVPTRFWCKTGFLAMAAALGLLAVVLVPGVGLAANGSLRWLPLGPVNLQVSEAARLLLLLYLAGYIVRHQDELRSSFAGFAKPMLVIVAACAMLIAEPDFGAATVLLAVALGLLFLGGVRLRDFALLFGGAVLVMGAVAASSPYRMRRLTAFLDPWADPYDAGFQLTQSLIAIGRGEWLGVGLGNSVQKLFYLPEAHTDFVFAVLAEELGLVGVAITLGLYAALVWRAFQLGHRAAERGLAYQAYLACALGLWLGLQAFINVGVNMGVLPTKGLTLPLVSYGGSSLVVSLVAFGLLLRIHHELVVAEGAPAPHPAPRRRRRS